MKKVILTKPQKIVVTLTIALILLTSLLYMYSEYWMERAKRGKIVYEQLTIAYNNKGVDGFKEILSKEFSDYRSSDAFLKITTQNLLNDKNALNTLNNAVKANRDALGNVKHFQLILYLITVSIIIIGISTTLILGFKK